ncbi:MAG: Mrp/NBP35 family ATP-binding protein [Halanaerobiales bacterium]|nr:Mrp/NBP35 family ATP-binding protein [Halanaerobiales bacterium]MCF8009257.1 Mrp/NBP35 family ATP-binding protein [Halanaerobiales bacterium]
MYEIKEGKIKLKHGSISEGLIAIASGKGGVGKSTVTANLAISLQKLGKKVGIIDADVHGFSIPRIIGIQKEVKVEQSSELIQPAEKMGVKVISMGSFVNEQNPVIWRSPLLLGALQQFFKDVIWGDLDYLLLDLPPGTGDMVLNIMQKLPHARTLIITTPQVTATNVAGRVGHMAEKMDSDIIGIIENMSYYQCSECGNKEYLFGKGGGKELADLLKVDMLGQLPLIKAIREGGDQGNPVVKEESDDKITKEFLKIAEQIIEKKRDFDPNLKPMSLKGGPGGN